MPLAGRRLLQRAFRLSPYGSHTSLSIMSSTKRGASKSPPKGAEVKKGKAGESEQESNRIPWGAFELTHDPTHTHATEPLVTELSTKAINTVRILAADMVQKANSGHPGYVHVPYG